MKPEPELPIDDEPPAELDPFATSHGEPEKESDEDG